MKKFEYKLLYREKLSCSTEDELNELGQEGWEAISFYGINMEYQCLLKREITE